MNWPYVFPCSPVPLAFGLYEVTVWHGSLVGYGPWYIFAVDRGPEENLLALGELRKGTRSVGLVELVTLVLFMGEEEISDHLHVDWLQRLTRALEGPVMKDLIGQRCAGVNWGSSRMVSRGFLDGRAVLSAVFMVLT